MKSHLRLFVFMFVVVFGGASATLYFFGRSGAEESARAQAILDDNTLRELCASPLQPGEVETPRCEEYRAKQAIKFAKEGK